MNAIRGELSDILWNYDIKNGLETTTEPENKAFLWEYKYIYRLDLIFKILASLYKL